MLYGNYREESSSFGALDNRPRSPGKLLATLCMKSGSGDEHRCCLSYDVGLEIWDPLEDITSPLEYEARINNHI